MSTQAKLLSAALLFVLAGLGWIATRGRTLEPRAAEQSAGTALAPAAEERASPGAAPASAVEQNERSAVVSAAEQPPPPTARDMPPYRYDLRVLARDGEDRPVSGAVVTVAPRGGRWNRAGTTDARGELAFSLRGFRPSLELALALRAGFGSASLTRRVVAHARGETRVACGLPGAGTFQLTLRASGDASQSGFLSGFLLEPVSIGFPDDAPALAAYDEGAAFVEPATVEAGVEQADGPVVDVTGDLEAQIFSSSFGTLELVGDSGSGGAVTLMVGGLAPSFDELPQDENHEQPVAHGLVRNAAGRALAGVRVEARGEDGGVRGGTWTNEEGEYRLQLESAVPVRLRVGGGERGLAATEWRPEVARELRWDPVLDRGHELLGRLVGPDGAPLARWKVELELDGASEPWWDAATAADDGRFAVPNLPRAPLRLFARPPDAPQRLATLVADDVWPDLAERSFELAADALRSARVLVSVLDGAGRPLDGADVRLWQVASGRGARLERADEPGVYSIDRLPPGDYELEAGDALHGLVVAPAFRLAPGEALDLGFVRLPAPAELRLARPELADGEGVTLALWRRDAEVELRALELEAWPQGALRLRAGEYDLRATLGERRIERRFALEPGELLELSLE